MKILCFGDSNTFGYDPCSTLGRRYPAGQRWVDILAENYSCTTVNLGVNGREIPTREAEFLSTEHMLSPDAPFDLLVIMLGTNDLLQGCTVPTVVSRMECFLERITLEKSKILLISPPPLVRGEWVDSQTLLDNSAVLGDEYKTLSARLGVHFADAGEWNIQLTFDGVHFTENGHNAFAKRLADNLKRRFNYA